LAGVAVEAGAVLLLDRGEAVQAADAHGIAIEGLASGGQTRRGNGVKVDALEARGLTPVVGRLQPDARATGDIEKGLATIAQLAAFATGKAVVVSRAYILAIAAAEPVLATLERTRGLRQWGVGAKRRVGVLALDADAEDWDDPAGVAALLEKAAAAGLAGVAVTGTPQALAHFADAGGVADRHGLFLAVRHAREEHR
jgi:DUF1009 family protein